ncbi:DNA primase [Coprothermobacteraceae bacterium]|nr:DNA primase [Coprothermobacteraceae bacterium]
MNLNEAAVYLRNNVDIVQLVSRYVTLKKVGRNYFGLCPFHSEKTPSFSVNPEKGIFKCFGCGAGGDAIAFLAKMEGLSYREAIKKLAAEAGIPVEENTRVDSLLGVLDEARKLLQGALRSRAGKQAREYLLERGVTDETIDKFFLGFDPTTDFLVEGLKRKGYSLEDLTQAGLLNSRGKDLFQGRVAFPILNAGGRTTGFGARALDPNNAVKYLNSQENLVFKKSRAIYGIHQAARDIEQSKTAIIVEGYFDVVVLHQQGFSNTIGILGTSLTEEQARILGRRVNRAVLLFDSDNAGMKAAVKSAFVLMTSNVEPLIAALPEGKDPDEIALSGRGSMQRVLDEAMEVAEFVKRLGDKLFGGVRSPEFLEFLFQNLSGLNLSPLLEMGIKTLSESLGVRSETLLDYVKKRPQGAVNKATTGPVQRVKPVGIEDIEEFMAKLLANTPELYPVLSSDEYFFPYTEGLREVMDVAQEWDPELGDIDSYLAMFPPHLREFAEEAMKLEFGPFEQREKMMVELLARWKVKDLDAHVERLRRQLAQAPSEDTLAALQEALQERDRIYRELQGQGIRVL